MSSSRLEAALTVFDDPAAKARELLRLHRAWSATHEVPGVLRPVVARAWQRQGTLPGPHRPLGDPQVAARRGRAENLASIVPLLEDRLLPLAAEAGNELVVSDDEGYVLWVTGPAPVRRKSEQLGYVQGARWRERDVGVNALGTAMEERRPVQIFGPEHGDEDQHPWVCTSAPLLDPRTGSLLGVVTLSGSYRTAHPHTLSLVTMAAGEAMGLLRERHADGLRRLARAAAQREGAGLRGGTLVVDDGGWVASADGFGVGERVRLPAGLAPGVRWVPGLGQVLAEPLEGGWLLRAARTADEARLELQPGPPAAARIVAGGEATHVPLTARHLEILLLLADHPAGLDAGGLLARLEGAQSEVTVRAELSRLRKRLGGLIESRPYRLTLPAAVVRH